MRSNPARPEAMARETTIIAPNWYAWHSAQPIQDQFVWYQTALAYRIRRISELAACFTPVPKLITAAICYAVELDNIEDQLVDENSLDSIFLGGRCHIRGHDRAKRLEGLLSISIDDENLSKAWQGTVEQIHQRRMADLLRAKECPDEFKAPIIDLTAVVTA